MSRHTPGPWKTEYDSFGDEIWFGGTGHGTWVVGPAYLGGRGKEPGGLEVMAADARLIAAAPEMYDELVWFVGFADANGIPCENARKLIAKIDGGGEGSGR